jgi:Holliday junction resolvase RusA-like endonuclease
MFQLELVLPFPPSRNHSHVVTKWGGLAPTKATLAYMDAVTCIVGEAVTTKPANDRFYVVEATYYYPDLRRRDTDNLRKVMADAMSAGLAVDDRWFLWRDQAVHLDRADPRVEIRMYPWQTSSSSPSQG